MSSLSRNVAASSTGEGRGRQCLALAARPRPTAAMTGASGSFGVTIGIDAISSGVWLQSPGRMP